MNKFLINLVKPMLKKILLKYVQNEKYQKEFIAKIESKIKIPNITKEDEEKYINSIYDVLQESVIDIVNKI